MRKLFYFVILLTFIGGSVFGQEMTKEEIKEWKKKQKAMDPLKYKEVSLEYGKLQAEKSKFNRESKKLKDKIQEQGEILESRNTQIEALQKRNNELRDQCGDMNVSAQGGEDYTVGVVYTVQIGAFSSKIYTQFQDTPGKFKVEEVDGVYKYTVAYFRDYKEATIFKEYIRDMGIKDAWIAVYNNNVRAHINDFIKPEDSTEN